MPLTLTLKASSTLPIEVEGLLPELCQGKSLAEVEQTPLFLGKEKLPLAEFFRLKGTTEDQDWLVQGEGACVHWLGAKMTRGKIRVVGNIGRHLGSQMRGGEIRVEGNAGDWLGAEMRGGRITVCGNATHQVGAAYRGSARGMRGGEIYIHGSAGNEIGARMRRGLIAVAGRSGDAPGYSMLAGTILLFGETGQRPGGNMKRGTIVCFAKTRPEVLPTFAPGARLRPSFMGILMCSLQQHRFPLEPKQEQTRFDFYSGDLLEGGRGELLVAAD